MPFPPRGCCMAPPSRWAPGCRRAGPAQPESCSPPTPGVAGVGHPERGRVLAGKDWPPPWAPALARMSAATPHPTLPKGASGMGMSSAGMGNPHPLETKRLQPYLGVPGAIYAMLFCAGHTRARLGCLQVWQFPPQGTSSPSTRRRRQMSPQHCPSHRPAGPGHRATGLQAPAG